MIILAFEINIKDEAIISNDIKRIGRYVSFITNEKVMRNQFTETVNDSVFNNIVSFHPRDGTHRVLAIKEDGDNILLLWWFCYRNPIKLCA